MNCLASGYGRKTKLQVDRRRTFVVQKKNYIFIFCNEIINFWIKNTGRMCVWTNGLDVDRYWVVQQISHHKNWQHPQNGRMINYPIWGPGFTSSAEPLPLFLTLYMISKTPPERWNLSCYRTTWCLPLEMRNVRSFVSLV